MVIYRTFHPLKLKCIFKCILNAYLMWFYASFFPKFSGPIDSFTAQKAHMVKNENSKTENHLNSVGYCASFYFSSKKSSYILIFLFWPIYENISTARALSRKIVTLIWEHEIDWPKIWDYSKQTINWPKFIRICFINKKWNFIFDLKSRGLKL